MENGYRLTMECANFSDSDCADYEDSRDGEVSVKVESEAVEDSVKPPGGKTRENRLTSIIDQLHHGNKRKGEGGGGSGGGAGGRRCARDAPPAPASAPAAPAPAPAQAPSQVKCERLSPHDNQSTASRSRSVTPSTSSYPGTPPERRSPPAAALLSASTASAPASGPRNYSDIMRSLAARYNAQHNNYYFNRVNGFSGCATMDSRGGAMSSPARGDTVEAALGGLFTRLAKHQGGPPRLPAFPDIIDMTSTRTLMAMSRVGRGGRDSRRRRHGLKAHSSGAEHSPLDLSAASEHAAKRARLSASPSTRSDSDERDQGSNDEGRGECLCAEARARLSEWTVDDVCDFVNSIDICAEYTSNFREQRIDGAGLPLLTEDHLTGMLHLKLGPALKLRAVIASRLGPCRKCQVKCQNGGPNTSLSGKLNGSVVKPEPRSNTTSPS